MDRAREGRGGEGIAKRGGRETNSSEVHHNEFPTSETTARLFFPPLLLSVPRIFLSLPTVKFRGSKLGDGFVYQIGKKERSARERERERASFRSNQFLGGKLSNVGTINVVSRVFLIPLIGPNFSNIDGWKFDKVSTN